MNRDYITQLAKIKLGITSDNRDILINAARDASIGRLLNVHGVPEMLDHPEYIMLVVDMTAESYKNSENKGTEPLHIIARLKEEFAKRLVAKK